MVSEEMADQVEGAIPEQGVPQAREASVENSVAGQVQGESVVVENSLVGAVSAGQNATVENSFTLVVAAGENASVENGGGILMLAGENMEITNGGGSIIAAGGNIELHNGGAGLMVCQQAAVENATISVLLAGQAQLGEGVKVVFSTRQAAALGAAFGAAVFALSLLFRRKRR